ncbi:HlyD family efflux transporter periplasmic adaptor subunit [Candidatus Peregrinibacteria bacterium]|nr:HlyD family efflux transporter periplasmic adaptor subunit [Candidatus Peregrinibacteria bacterium]
MKALLSKKIVRYGLIILGVAAAAYFLFGNNDETEYVLAEATMGDITQTVSVTGTIKADPSIDLHFQTGGKVKEILVEEGEQVQEGQLLASLTNESLELEVERNKANVDYARAQYNQTKAGAKYEEILIAQADLESAQASYNAAQIEVDNTRSLSESNIDLATIAYKQAQANRDAALKELETTKLLAENELAKLDLEGENTQTVALDSAYSKAQTNLDSLLTIMQDSMFLAEDILGIRGTGFALLGTSKKNRLKKDYYEPTNEKYEAALTLYQELPSDPTHEELDEAFEESVTAANSVLLLLTQLGTELENLPYSRTDLENLIVQVTTKSSSLSASILTLKEAQSTIENIKTGSVQDIETLKLNYELQIDAAQSRYDKAENALSEAAYNLEQAKLNAEIAVENAQAMVALKKAALDSAHAALALKQSPARDVDLAPLLANISQAEIALRIAENKYEDSQLTAPIDGIVTFIYGTVGENVSLSETALSAFLALQADQLIVEANVPETDIIKVNEGDTVEMTIDAFDFTEKFNGSVIYTDPAETIIQGVVYYEIKTAFDLEDERLKSGMTANLEIITDQKENVLTIPARAIKYEDSIRYVEVLNNGAPKKTTITTGLESDQYVEVTSGLKQGDKIITFVK